MRVHFPYGSFYKVRCFLFYTFRRKRNPEGTKGKAVMESSENEVVAEGARRKAVNSTYPCVSLTRLILPQDTNSFVCYQGDPTFDVQYDRGPNANHSDEGSWIITDTWAEDGAVDVGWSMLDHVNQDMGSRCGH